MICEGYVYSDYALEIYNLLYDKQPIPTPASDFNWYDNYLKRRVISSMYEYLTCEAVPVQITFTNIRLNNYTVVGRCPPRSVNVSYDNYLGCEAPKFNSSKDPLPPVVTDDGIIFKNQHCAYCHGFRKEDIRYWDTRIMCLQKADEIEKLFANENISVILDHVHQNYLCEVFYDVTGIPWKSFEADPKLRHCRPDDNVVRTCPKNTSASEGVQRVCKLYRNDVTTSGLNLIFKNTHCALCNEVNATDIMCPPPQPRLVPSEDGHGTNPELAPFSILLDFTSSSELTFKNEGRMCRDPDKVYVPDERKCKLLHCPLGEHYRNGKCVTVIQGKTSFGSSGNLNSGTYSVKVAVHINYTYDDLKDSSFATNFNPSFANSLVIKMFKLDSVGSDYTFILGQIIADQKNNNILEYEFDLTLKLANSSFIYVYDILNNAVKDGLGWHEIRNTFFSVHSIFVSNFQYQNPLQCIHGVKPIKREFRLATRNRSAFDERIRSERHVLGNARFNFTFQTINDSLVIDINGHACKSRKLRCPTISYSPTEYEKMNGSAQVISTGRVYQDESYEIINDSLHVCSNFTQQYTTRGEHFFMYTHSEAQGLLTLVCSVISLLCLFITFIAFCIFTKYRTKPGLSMMNFIIALFIAQLILVVGVNRTTIPELCKAIAIVEHYTWLVVFFWMSAMSYDIFLTFRNFSSIPDESMSNMKKYIVYAWGAPAVIVAVCCVIDFCECTGLDFGYGGPTRCWIMDSSALIFSFALPIGLIILSNAVLFILTAVVLYKTLQQIPSSKRKTWKELLGIYLKLTTIMGFTWLFGFIAAFTEITELWYLFIVFNSLQGMFVFFAYVCNKRSFKKCASFFSRKGVNECYGGAQNGTGDAQASSDRVENTKV